MYIDKSDYNRCMHSLQLCRETGFTHDYLGTQFASMLMWLLPSNFELFKSKTSIGKIKKYGELYDESQNPYLFSGSVKGKIKDLDKLVNEINALINPNKKIIDMDKENLIGIIKKANEVYNLVCKCSENHGRIFYRFGI